MKKILFVVISTLIVIYSTVSASEAAVRIKCWNKTNENATAPFIIADIEYHNQLSNIRFIYKKSMAKMGVTVKDHLDSVTATEITSNRSPYKGAQRFAVKESGYLILPTDLTNEKLKRVLKKGIGMGPGENGVFITSYDQRDGAGSHVSYRLTCESDI